MSTSSTRDERITRGSASGIAWNARERPRDVVSTETGIAIAWIESAEDRANASEGAEADRAIASEGEVATDCRILTSRRFSETSDRVTEGIATESAIAIGIARDDGRGATIETVIEIVSETSVTGIAIAGTGRSAVIVKMRTRKRSELRRSLWTIIRTTVIRSRRQVRTSPPSSTRTITIRRWRRNTGFRRVDPIRLRTTITIPYKIIDPASACFSSCSVFFLLCVISHCIVMVLFLLHNIIGSVKSREMLRRINNIVQTIARNSRNVCFNTVEIYADSESSLSICLFLALSFSLSPSPHLSLTHDTDTFYVSKGNIFLY